jgi:hypothetical protein
MNMKRGDKHDLQMMILAQKFQIQDLENALRECVTDDGAHCMNDDVRGERARRRLYAINAVVNSALSKVSA